VDALTLDEQCRLLCWLEQVQLSMRVVSLTATSLVESIQAGTFLDRLYYRLNTLYLEARDLSVDVGTTPSR
jgi:DNA-binding NtrC family response regulator